MGKNFKSGDEYEVNTRGVGRFSISDSEMQLESELLDYLEFRIFKMISHKDRAKSFLNEVINVNSVKSLKKLVFDQSKIVNGEINMPLGLAKHEQPLKNKTADDYHLLINRWSKRLIPEQDQRAINDNRGPASTVQPVMNRRTQR